MVRGDVKLYPFLAAATNESGGVVVLVLAYRDFWAKAQTTNPSPPLLDCGASDRLVLTGGDVMADRLINISSMGRENRLIHQ